MTAALPAPVAARAYRISNVLFTAARGAALIGLAVVIGIVLLQVVDNPTGGSDGDSSGPSTVTSDTSGDNGNNGNNGGVDPADVSVIVLNGSGVTGAAGTQSDALLSLGYQTIPPGDAPATQEETTVACNPENQAAVDGLLAAIPGATATEYPAQPPVPEASAADCIVTLGTATAAATPST